MPARFPRALRAGRQTVCLEVHPPRSRSSPRSPRRTPTVPVLIRCYMTDTEPQRNSEWDHLGQANMHSCSCLTRRTIIAIRCQSIPDGGVVVDEQDAHYLLLTFL